jgi:hypothetical protein
MRKRFRSLVSALAIVGLVASLASPAGAFQRDDGDAESSVPVVFDVVVLRPMGLLMTMGGVVLYLFPVAPITALTRPTDITKPLGPLVAAPGRYTFVDPLGMHP